MRCIGKEYRVVCSKTPNKHIIVDIVPADNALHRLILKERNQRNDGTQIIAGSITLYDMGENNQPKIIFLPPENGGLPPAELSKATENLLRHKIISRFKQMKAQNQQSTITVRPEIHQEYIDDICADMLSNVNASLYAAAAPQSPQEEQYQLFVERRQRAEHTRRQTAEYLRRRDEKYTSSGTSALQIKQLIHRDY